MIGGAFVFVETFNDLHLRLCLVQFRFLVILLKFFFLDYTQLCASILLLS